MKLETQAIHAGFSEDPTTRAVAVPIYQTTSYSFRDTQHGADLFDLKEPGNIYSRIMNPTNAVLEERLAAMEGGIAALCMASGMAAITAALQTLARAGDNIVSVSQLYGGSYNLFAHTFPQQGIEVRMASGDDVAALEALIDDNTRALFCESIGNPAGNVVDIKALADMAHKHGVPVVVDNTVGTPFLCRPFEFGADIVVHSLTKYIGGHGTTLGGAIVDSGKFPWKDNPRFKQFNEPDPSYHGVVYTEAMGPAAFIARARVVPLRNMGAALSPMNAFMLLQGLETLALRMERHVENAQKVAEYLQAHEQVNWVNYAGLKDNRYYDVAQRMLGGKPSAILSFGIKGGAAAGAKFIDALQMIKRLVNIGDAKSLACHPATTTYRQLNEKELASAGVSSDLVRLSIGIEHIDDIIADIAQALAAANN
ncbi:MAG: O-acetylhomoserine aminocarboxypropyltransferase [Oceanospirillaceae bacterium]|uniref:O-acetylhomoserine aminocarboxypropyltransferase/cysteine synthase family protein n=1 Tax=unclassified Thalassolituus TaxID=2624967 RepID=UPI000C692785|nr:MULTISPECIES: aminotransferase class I/II-fold pyridoxal phosphate-dependent enzyme [unclassified Thalassolituus]MAS24512.1 O-acetylhomoserine aminocarboxypropyltransferase [Oceanospirillaceae bacterium]MAY00416.1 O-acetylhomoserine aminocarboxypropyltransferase [Oceanospirillaceae bacterium]MBL34026.1 O-acetylhomoserine aminocarboxypropyltransferase [Oceanospirillaceae bacterium]MBS52030.1 O-acetylhomoserine aminocarboxypropyltransferase [Oceanospirillaceae bacterium]|tara:strand:- start:342 stop:1616 length:1275 start_codon:yes stop_codon:yes gene_type:complete